MMSFLKNLTKGVENSSVLDEGINSSEFTGSIDTGCYIMNAILSGSIYGGMPNNKVVALAGESSSGKCARGSEKIVVYCKESDVEKIRNRL
jgi:RecA/RadA recombinase